MKEFILKYKVFLIVAVLLVLFVVLSVLLGENKTENVEMKDDLTEWLSDTKKDESVVSVIAQTTCGHCIAFKPVMQKTANKYGFNIYWFEANLMSKEDYTSLTSTYELTGYSGTPYTFIIKNGKFVDYISGETDEENLVKFLKNNNVI